MTFCWYGDTLLLGLHLDQDGAVHLHANNRDLIVIRSSWRAGAILGLQLINLGGRVLIRSVRNVTRR
jgi:hypothetical protein